MSVKFAVGIGSASQPAATGIQTIYANNRVGKASEIKAAIVFAACTDNTDNTRYDNAFWSFGVVAGAEPVQKMCGNYAEDNLGTSVAHGQSNTGSILGTTKASSVVEFNAAFVEFVNNGIKLNWRTISSKTINVTVIFIAGSDVQAHVGQAIATAAGTDYTDAGFEPNVVIAFGNSGTFSTWPTTGGATNARGSVGICINDPTNGIIQRHLGWYFANSQATSVATAILRNESSFSAPTTAAGTYATLSSFDSSGFTVTRSGSPNITLAFLALRIENVSVNLIDFTTATATGITTYNPALRSGMLMSLFSTLTAQNTLAANTEAGFFGIGFSDKKSQIAYSIAFEDGLATTNCHVHADDSKFLLSWNDALIGDVMAVYQASLSDIRSEVFDLSYDVVYESGLYGCVLCVEEDPVGARKTFRSP